MESNDAETVALVAKLAAEVEVIAGLCQKIVDQIADFEAKFNERLMKLED